MTFAENSITIPVANNEEIRQLLGRFDQHVTLLERYFKVNIIPQGNAVIVEGKQEDTEKVAFLFRELLWLLQQGQVPTVPDVEYAIELIRTGQAERLRGLLSDIIYITPRGKKIKPKTIGQKGYLDAIRKNDIVFAIGPAGTGKTYLAMTMAVKAL